MAGECTIWDPLRKKDVAHTPEEDVRQWFIVQLQRLMGVPGHMMMSEVGFSLGQKVECKRPDVALDRDVLDQAVRYNMVLNVRYIFITNGKSTFVCRRKAVEDPGYEFVGTLPSYDEMQK